VKQSSIRFLIPYFGRWPAWMPFFVQSVRWNPTIDWVFYSDCGPILDCPKNLSLQSVSFEDYCAKVSGALQIAFKPPNPYKLCDVKPAYGLIHQEDLVQADFWAFGDIDVVYGNLREYFSEQRLKDCDLLSTHNRRVSGHLCLIRNTPQTNSLFKKVSGWEGIFESKKHTAFDEGAFSRLFLRHKNLPDLLARFPRLLNPLYRRAEFEEAWSTPHASLNWHTGKRDFPGIWTCSPQGLTNNQDGSRRFPYLHFRKWKHSIESQADLQAQKELLRDHDTCFNLSSEGIHVSCN
jgi:hypothetical protein